MSLREKKGKVEKRTYGLELEGNELETLVLETLDDLTDETTLDTVGLNLLKDGMK